MIINSIAASMYIKLYQCHPPTSSLPVYEPSWHPSLRSKLFPPRTQFSNLRAKDGAMVCKSMMTLGQESIQANNTHRFCGPLLLRVQPTKSNNQTTNWIRPSIQDYVCSTTAWCDHLLWCLKAPQREQQLSSSRQTLESSQVLVGYYWFSNGISQSVTRVSISTQMSPWSVWWLRSC